MARKTKTQQIQELKEEIAVLKHEVYKTLSEDMHELKADIKELINNDIVFIKQRLTAIETLVSDNGLKKRIEDNERSIGNLDKRVNGVEKKIVKIFAVGGTIWLVLQIIFTLIGLGVIRIGG